jgi:amidase
MTHSTMSADDDNRSNASGRREEVHPPSIEQVNRYAECQQLALDEDIAGRRERILAFLDEFRRLDDLQPPPVRLRHPRRHAGHVPTASEDPNNAVIRFCNVDGAATGPLAGTRIGVKDNIAVAGVPMTDGEPNRDPVVPTEDAVVVERLLDAGAAIVAKTNIDAAFGATTNPRGPRYDAGGSSSGSAAAVAGGLIDAALGVDQGGSIRIPAAWCGIVGMKATHGLVPSYGLTYWDHTLDHIGPMTSTVAANAAVLQVIAGGDWRDPQWVRDLPHVGDYDAAARLGVAGLRVGSIAEAVSPSSCSADAVERFEEAESILKGLGVEMVRVSVPLWSEAFSIWLAAVTFGLAGMAESFGGGFGHLGRINVDRFRETGRRYWSGQRLLQFGGDVLPLVFEHLRRGPYFGSHFALAHNLRLELRRQIDAHLEDVDLLATPTTPTGPPRIGEPPPSDPDLRVQFSQMLNTCPLNLTGHPALTVPSGVAENDLPTGLQIIGRRFEEHTVYRAAFAVEARERW